MLHSSDAFEPARTVILGNKTSEIYILIGIHKYTKTYRVDLYQLRYSKTDNDSFNINSHQWIYTIWLPSLLPKLKFHLPNDVFSLQWLNKIPGVLQKISLMLSMYFHKILVSFLRFQLKTSDCPLPKHALCLVWGKIV